MEQEAGIFNHSETQVDNAGVPVKAMPGRDDVFIVVGFPCPGYSGVSRHQKADDIKKPSY